MTGFFSENFHKKPCKWVEVGSKLTSVDKQRRDPELKTKTTAPQKLSTKNRSDKYVGSVDYFERKLDDKRRLTIPAELRAEFAGGVVVTRGFSTYLHVYPQVIWDSEVEPALGGDILDERIADLNVQFRTGKTYAQPDDKQGRITLEQHLLDYAGIDKAVVAVRAGKYWRLMAA